MYNTMQGITDDTKYSPNLVQENSNYYNFNENVCAPKKIDYTSSKKVRFNDEVEVLSPQDARFERQPIDMVLHKQSKSSLKKLLPVLETKFNLREICKQCILLEDHLSQNEKQCHDCIVKHFLALEGLSEEAITLDKNNENPNNVQKLPEKIRELQKLWYENPEKTHECSQELRKIRKTMMEDCFPIIFDKNTKSCSSNQCKM